MALDQQSNWDIQMAQPFRNPGKRGRSAVPSSDNANVQLVPTQWTREIRLPTRKISADAVKEIMEQIIAFIPLRPDSQPTLHALTLVSRAWYSAAITFLYAHPSITPSNFSQFTDTICPSKNAHIKHSDLAPMVRTLDMSNLVHNSTRSLTARLLGRLKHNLIAFIAPQASFAINSFAALSKCQHLLYLDLSLISASISKKLLFHTLKSLPNLKTLSFPRSSNLDAETKVGIVYDWPPKLESLHLAGGIDTHFLTIQFSGVPQSLQKLSIQHCSQVYPETLLPALENIGPQLKHLTIRHPMTKLHRGALDRVLFICPNLTALRISADYITIGLFTSLDLFPRKAIHPLQVLDLECSSQASPEVQIQPGIVYVAVESNRLAKLRRVCVSARLAWTATPVNRQDIKDLVEVMSDLDMEDPWGRGEVGVWPSVPDL